MFRRAPGAVAEEHVFEHEMAVLEPRIPFEIKSGREAVAAFDGQPQRARCRVEAVAAPIILVGFEGHEGHRETVGPEFELADRFHVVAARGRRLMPRPRQHERVARHDLESGDDRLASYRVTQHDLGARRRVGADGQRPPVRAELGGAHERPA